MPRDSKISNLQFSPSEKVGFIHQGTEGNEFWVADINTRSAERWGKASLNSTIGKPFQWIDDNNILAKTVRLSNSPPQISAIPTGPTIQETDGVAAPAATYQDLLKTLVTLCNLNIIVPVIWPKSVLQDQPISFKTRSSRVLIFLLIRDISY